MPQLVANVFVSMDGVMQAPGGPDEDRDGGFEHGGWMVPFFDDVIANDVTEWTDRAGAFLLGRRTYEIFAASWPKATDPADPVASALNNRPKYVASRTLHRVEWNNSHLLREDLSSSVARLKEAEGGEIQVHGSPGLLQTLFREDLVDVLRIWQFPVTIGTGKRLFAEGTMARSFRVLRTVTATTGAVLQVYERIGQVRHGEFEVGEEIRVLD